MPIKTIQEVCSLILGWTENSRELPGAPFESHVAIPDCVLDLNSRLGQVWQGFEHNLKVIPHISDQPMRLFELQDQILDPRTYKTDSDGVIPIVWENQGVWGLGFEPSDPNQLLACRDWYDDKSSEAWRPTGAYVEDGIVWTLLNNFCFMASDEKSSCNLDDFDDRPKEADTLLWNHPSWKSFDGFWTNSTRTLIFYSGMGLTIRR